MEPGATQPTTVDLVVAGRVFLPPSNESQEPWIEIRDAFDRVVWSALERQLPGIAGEGYFALLPPGTYRVAVSTGRARKDPKTYHAVSAAGSTTRVE